VSILALLIAGFFAFYGTGIKGGPVYASNALESVGLNAVSIVGIFVGILSILVICHEYRYNTIYYTLTASNSRLKVFFAKLITIALYGVAITVLTVAFSIGVMILGAHIAGHDLGMQSIDLYSLAWRTLVYMVGAAWLGLLLGFLSRSQVFAIVAYFVIPSIEPLIHTFLKVSNNYLPSASMNQILQTTPSNGVFSPLASAGIFYLYLLIAGIVAAVLFVRKDAN
jgi:ABC-type transport system involved in multi-copper enzyme maturation permease subunit